MKKVLAWAVALALVLSSFTMAFAADAPQSSKDFSDADQIHYNEAVDVLVATGIIGGFPEGDFRPAGDVTRGQMAKMIACIKNGGEDVGDQYKSACPFADSKSDWAAGYIAYCASEHIIDGRSADVFDPTGKVTGTEVAKMALTTLGYDSKIQGYTGETWAAAVLKDAKKNNLFEGLDESFVPGDPCNRECAAQILFNMLKATEVEYTNGTSVSIGDDISVVVDSEIKNVPSGKQEDGATPDMQLYEDVFGGKLVQNADEPDEFGRPAHNWTYPDEDTVVGEYPDAADYEFTAEATPIDKAIEAYDSDLAKKLKKDKTMPKDADVTVNGGIDSGLALGDKVELFYDKEDNAYTVVVTQYKPARITEVNTEVEENEDGITAELTLEGAITTGNNKMAGYDEATYVKGAVIAVALGEDDAVMDSYVMEEAAKGEVTKVTTKAPIKYTVDGKDYQRAGNNTVDFDGDVTAIKDKVYVLYDYNGYVLATTVEQEATPTVETFYGVIANKKTEEGTSDWDTEPASADVDKVQMFTTDGEFVPMTINNEAKNAENSKIGSYDKYDLVAYSLNDDGEIISIAKAETSTGFDKALKEGTLNGSDVAEDVAVFDIYKSPAEGQDAPGEAKKAEDWAVLGMSDLEAAEGVISVNSACQDEESGEYVALLLKKPLAEEPATTEDVLGFISGYEEFSTADGEFATITFWKDGKEESKTTAEKVYGTTITDLDDFDADELVKITLQDDEVIGVASVDALDVVSAPVDKFTGENVAAVYTADEDCDATTDATTYYTKPVSKTTTTQLVFGTETINKQTVSKATIYELKEGKLVVSKLASIKSGMEAKVYQLNAESGVWNVVIYKEVAAPAPTPDPTPNPTPDPTPDPTPEP